MTNKLADGLIEKTISTSVEIASKTVYKKEYRYPLWKKKHDIEWSEQCSF